MEEVALVTLVDLSGRGDAINQSINQSTNQPTNQPINKSINLVDLSGRVDADGTGRLGDEDGTGGQSSPASPMPRPAQSINLHQSICINQSASTNLHQSRN